MALGFDCAKCGAHIITKFLKVGEVAKCRNCGANNVVPEDAVETTEEPVYDKPVPPRSKVTDPGTEATGKVRPASMVIGLTFITLGVYFWVYLFKTLREIQNSFTFDTHEETPLKTRPLLIALLLVTILTVIISFSIGYSMGTQLDGPKSAKYYIWLGIENIIFSVFFLLYWSSFIDLIAVCQRKVGHRPLFKGNFWAVMIIIVLLSFISISIAAVNYLSVIIGFVWIYMIASQVNRLWNIRSTVE